jgi:hypothetical protein
MTLLLQAAFLALGVCLSIRMIAALHRVADLWYTIGTAYPRVLRGIFAWAAAIAACAWLLKPPYRAAFTSGLLAFLLFYPSLYVLRHPFLRALERRASRPPP